MKAAVCRGPGRLALEEIALPDVPPDGLMIDVRSCGICGSDLRTVRNGFRFGQSWQVLGHEVTGVVAEVGADVDGYRPGDRLAIAPDVHCGSCRYCSRGLFNLCENFQLVGAHFAGGLAERMVLPAEILQRGVVHRIPDGVDFEAAALAEPASSVIDAQADAGVRDGDRVAIIGAGPIGCLHAEVALSNGATPFLIDNNGRRLALVADRLGFETVVDSSRVEPIAAVRAITGDFGVDVAIVACPDPNAVAQAVEMVRKQGTVVVFGGFPTADPRVTVDGNRVHYDELTIVGSFSYRPERHREALEAIAEGRIRADRFITHRFPLEEVTDAFATAGGGAALKVVVTVGRTA